MKNKLLVSFSGGETSAFMAQWLWNNKKNEFDMVFVFANTGQENEQTLNFVQKCSEHFGFKVHWVESLVFEEKSQGTSYSEVNFEKADRIGNTFENVIKKYGIPNQAFPHCTRELKLQPIRKFASDYFGEDYFTAVGIRSDEADRISKEARKNKIIYPLISNKFIPSTKPEINYYWSKMPFRLDLKSYQGNCKWCWKKSLKKLQKIAYENPEFFEFPKLMENKYGKGEFTFFRNNLSANEILEIAHNHKVVDDSRFDGYQLNIDLIGGESCEIFAECGE